MKKFDVAIAGVELIGAAIALDLSRAYKEGRRALAGNESRGGRLPGMNKLDC